MTHPDHAEPAKGRSCTSGAQALTCMQQDMLWNTVQRWRRNLAVEIISGESPACVSLMCSVIVTYTFIVAAVLHRSRVSYFLALSATPCLMHGFFNDSGCCSLPFHIVFFILLLQCFVN